MQELKEALKGRVGWSIFLTAVAIRVLDWSLSSYSHDEFSALLRLSQTHSWTSFWESAVMVDAHPAGVQAWLTGWVKFGDFLGVTQHGSAEWWVKLPFLAVSLSGLWALVLMVRRAAGREAAWLTLACWAGLQWPVLQSAIARPYAPGLALVLWAGAMLLEPRLKRRNIRLALVLALAAYMHHFAALQVAFLWSFAMIFGPKHDRLELWKSAALAALIYAPHVPVLLHQFGHGGLGSFLDKPSPSFFVSYLRLLLNDSAMLWLLLGLPAISISLVIRRFEGWRWAALGVALFFLPLGLAYGYSTWRAPILMDRTLFFASPFLVAGLSIAAMEGWKRWVPWNARGFVLLVGCTSIATLFSNRQHHAIAWESPYEGVLEAVSEQDSVVSLLNGPSHAWDFVRAKYSMDLKYTTASMDLLRGLAGDSLQLGVALGRAANHEFLSADADGLLLMERHLLEHRCFYNGDFRRYGPVRQAGELAAGIVAYNPGAMRKEFGPTVKANLQDILDASLGGAHPNPNREVYAGIQLSGPIAGEGELVLTCSLGDEIVFYRSAKLNQGTGHWQALGLRLADLGLTQSESEQVEFAAYVWNPKRTPLQLGALVLAAGAGNPYQYAWSQPVPKDKAHQTH